jgi:hypothetical protein
MNRSSLLSKLENYKETHGQKYGILSLGIFGSVARNQATEFSDVDIVVQMETPDPFTIAHIKEELETELHMSVDIVRYREKMNPFLKSRIEKEGIYVR